MNIPPLLIVPIHTLTASLDQKCAVRRLGKSQSRQEEKKGHFPKAIFSLPPLIEAAAAQQLQWVCLRVIKYPFHYYSQKGVKGKKINHAPCAKKYDCALIDLCYMYLQFVCYFLIDMICSGFDKNTVNREVLYLSIHSWPKNYAVTTIAIFNGNR